MIISCNVILLLFVAIAILFSRNLIVDVILLGIFSLLMSLFYILNNAPDVAITEAAVGVTLSTVFALSALILHRETTVERGNIIGFIILSLALFTLLLLLPYLFDFGFPLVNEVSDYYIQNTTTRLGFTNIVTGILASFRGFDTFIETIVIFTAANAVYMLVGQDEKAK